MGRYPRGAEKFWSAGRFETLSFKKFSKILADLFRRMRTLGGFRTPRLDVLKVVFLKILKNPSDLFSKNENFRDF
jgi:hypothetical protein